MLIRRALTKIVELRPAHVLLVAADLERRCGPQRTRQDQEKSQSKAKEAENPEVARKPLGILLDLIAVPRRLHPYFRLELVPLIELGVQMSLQLARFAYRA